MSNIVYSAASQTRARASTTPQTQPLPGQESNMAMNHQGGFAFVLDDFVRLDRFLVLGSESGTYYQSAQALTQENAEATIRAIKTDGVRVVRRIVEISTAGRAPKNDSALFALALVMTHGDAVARRAAGMAVPEVARIGTHILQLAEYVNGMRGWGRSVSRAFSEWYNGKSSMSVARQITKYANRSRWRHSDILRLAHIKPISSTHAALFSDALGKTNEFDIDADVAAYMSAVDTLKQSTDVQEAVQLITEFQLPREIIPTAMMGDTAVWGALVPHMGLTALVRNLATMTRAGYIKPMSTGTDVVIAKMRDAEAVKQSRIHPIQVLSALITYESGQSVRGTTSWTPVVQIVDALNDMFYLAFANVVPTGARTGIFLDVSASMTVGDIAGVPGLTPRIASAALAMMTLRTESRYVTMGFTATGGVNRHRRASVLTPLSLSPSQRLDNVVSAISNIPFGGTDCALPMLWAKENKVELDAFIIYTDNETAHGDIHPMEALRQYRRATGINAKLIVVGMTATHFSIADPDDGGSMDVVGFDSAAPAIMSDFIRGTV